MIKKLISGWIAALLLTVSAVGIGTAAEEASYECLENVAIGASIIGTPGEGDASNLINGSWYEVLKHAAGMGIDLVVDLGSAKPLARLSVYTRQAAAASDGIEISVSETGDEYIPVGETQGSESKTVVGQDNYGASIVRHDFTVNGNYQYVKLFRDASESWVHIQGFAAYAVTPAAAVPADGNLARGKNITVDNIDPANGDVTKLVDGNDVEQTNFNVAYSRVILDLGGNYPIDGIRLCGRMDNSEWSSGQGVYLELSPTAYFDPDETHTVTSVYTFHAGDNVFSVADKEKRFRYVRLRGDWLVPSELEVYIARDTVSGDGQGNLALNKPVFAAGGMQKSQVENCNNALESGFCEFYRSLETNVMYGYAQFDLLDSYDIGTVVVSFRTSSQKNERSGWQVLLSNDFAFSDAKDLGTLTTPSPNGEDWIIQVPEAANYRYVRLVKADAQYGLIQELAVYGKDNTRVAGISSADIKDVAGISPNGTPYIHSERWESLTITPGYTLAEDTVILVVATYDSTGHRTGFNMVDLSNRLNDNVFGNEDIVVNFDWAVNCPENGGTARAFLWKNMSSLTPLTDSFEKTVNPEA